MKWMIASDLHGSAYYGKKMVEAFEREGAPERPAPGLCAQGGHPAAEQPEGQALLCPGQLRC